MSHIGSVILPFELSVGNLIFLIFGSLSSSNSLCYFPEFWASFLAWARDIFHSVNYPSDDTDSFGRADQSRVE